MKLYRLAFLLCLTVYPAVFLTGCGDLFSGLFPPEPSAEEKMAVVRVCDEYFRNIAQGNYSQVEGMIAWAEYEPAKNDGVTRALFAERIVANKGRWSPQEHPLLGVEVQDVSIRGDRAKVVLEKKSLKQKYEIRMSWAGRGWLIISDNVFAANGVYR